jgi:hypothetical protein
MLLGRGGFYNWGSIELALEAWRLRIGDGAFDIGHGRLH